MTFVYYIAAIAFAAVMFLLLYRFGSKKLIGGFTGIQLASLLYGALFFVRIFGGDFLISETLKLNIYSPFGVNGGMLSILAALLLWLIFTVQLAVVTYPFFEKHIPLVAPTVRFVAPIVYAVSVIALPILNKALDGELSGGFHYRLLIFALELGLGLAVSLSHLFRGSKAKLNTPDKLRSVLIFLGMLLISMPMWLPQVIFGEGDKDITATDLNIYHRILLYGMVLFFAAIHFLFRKCNEEQKRYALIYISMALMISFCHKYDFADFLDLTKWPFHLCNTALFIIPIVLIFKLEKLYYFTLFINVLGAFFAMIMPNIEDPLLSDSLVEFWSSHYAAMLLPLLIMSLKLFKRPKIKQFTYSLVAFAVYFALIIFLNTWLTNYDPGIDFFFTNSDFVAEKLGEWAEDLRDIKAEFTINDLKFVFYPVYQILFFLAYVLLSFAMWFIYEQIFEVTDTYEIISERNRKIKADRLALEASLAGRSMQEPLHPENDGKLILRNFSKRYSTSDVYAVYNASLEIDGGQIFGFLGPNGAGKSTIIKTIVGMQTITSGEIEISGFDAEKQSVEAKMQIGFVPDHYALYENLTGREYVNYIADLYNVSKEDRDRRIADYVARFRLEGAFDNPMKTYSHGMKQKITIMSALVHNPKIWILDEPLTGLDPESIFQVKECMKQHAQEGNIVFFSSHIIDVVERICDRIAIIRKGQILCTKTVAEIKESGTPLEEFYIKMIDGNTAAPVSVKEAATSCEKSVNSGETV